MADLARPRRKLNELLVKWPKGTVAVQAWLRGQGVSRQLADAYRRSNWVRRIGGGAYVRAGDHVDWTGALYAVQGQLGLPVHVGAKTALQMQGYAHFLPLREGGVVQLFGAPGTRLPAWFLHSDWKVKLLYAATNLLAGKTEVGLTHKPMGEYSIRLSAPERAMLELLYLVPRTESFEEARLLMEGLTTLRPRLVQDLLEACRSVKVKRLFLFLADESSHSWARKQDLSKIDLGSGKRVIVKGGRFDSKYQITVPGRRAQPPPPGEAP